MPFTQPQQMGIYPRVTKVPIKGSALLASNPYFFSLSNTRDGVHGKIWQEAKMFLPVFSHADAGDAVREREKLRKPRGLWSWWVRDGDTESGVHSFSWVMGGYETQSNSRVSKIKWQG